MTFLTVIAYLAILGILALFFRFINQLDCNVQLALKEKFGLSQNRLQNKVIWVTGASAGIGEQLALYLAKLGCRLIISARNECQLNNVKQQCLKINKRLTDDDVLVLSFDMSKMEQHEAALQQVLDHFGRLDVLINNAGVAQAGPFEQIELELDRKVFETNVFGPLNLSRLVCTHWLRCKMSGHLVLNSSTSAILRNPWSSSYVASKAAISSYFECLEKESIGLEYPIHTTIVYPGPIDTGIFNRSYRWKVGQSYDKNFVQESVESGCFSWVSAERCAELFAVAIVNQVRSCWIARQPILGFTFIAHYMPFLAIPVWRFIMRFKHKSLKQLYLN